MQTLELIEYKMHTPNICILWKSIIDLLKSIIPLNKKIVKK